MAFTLAAGVFISWLDYGIAPATVVSSIGGGAFHADRGSLTPRSVTSYEAFTKVYGNGNYKRSYGHDTFRAFFRTGQAAVAVRSPGQGAKYATALVANNYVKTTVSASHPDGYMYEGSSVTPLAGSEVDFTQVNADAWDLVFSADMPKTATAAMKINDTAVATTTSDGNMHTFMAQLAQNITTVLQAMDDSFGATAVVVPRVKEAIAATDTTTTPRTIRVVGPQNVLLTFSNIVLSNATGVSLAARQTEWLAWTVAENPGAWGKNTALKFQQLDFGKNSSVQLMLDGQADALNSFTGTVNGVDITVAANAAGNNALLTDIAAAIHTNVPNVTATVKAANGVNANRIIVITANDNTFDIKVTGAMLLKNAAASAPLVNVSTLVARYVPDTDFALYVYDYPNLRIAKATYAATFAEALSANGNTTNFAAQVNKGAKRSEHIRIYTNPLVATNGWTLQSSTQLDHTTGEGFLAGGADGALSTSADIINAWSQLIDPTVYTVRILMNCGYATQAVHQYMTTLCETRRDCVAILDMAPDDQTDDQTCIEARYALNINSSYAAIYTPDIVIFDRDLNIHRSSPPSGYVGAVYALTDKLHAEWWSPAGLNRGEIPEAESVTVVYDAGMQSNMNAAQINPIINYRRQMICVFGDWTLYYANSPFQYIGTRRMCNTIEITATLTVAYSLYEPNTKATRDNVIRVSNEILQRIQDAQGINRFKVYDLTQSYHIDARQAYFRYVIDPVTSIHQILIDGIITRNNASFSEYASVNANDNVSTFAAAS
jgi:hypothetical protein